MSTQDDKAVRFSASDTKRGSKSSYVKEPNPNPKRYKANSAKSTSTKMKTSSRKGRSGY